MGITKTEEFTVKQNKIAKFAKALGHPARIAILEVLTKRMDCMCGDIVEEPVAIDALQGTNKVLENQRENQRENTVDIENTVDDTIYQSIRLGTFSYSIPVPIGAYEVSIHLAELYVLSPICF